MLDEPQWYPNQTTVRIAMLDCPAYLTIPQLHWTRSKAVFTLWNHFFDDTQRMLLMAALNTHGVDELFYKAAFLECERHLVLLAQEIEDIGRNEICVGGMGTNQRLHDIRRVLHRLKVCVQENRAQEVRVARASSLRATGSDMRVREEFQSLVLMVKDLEMSLVQAFQLLMSTMSVKEMRDSLEQTRATHEQTRSMNVLTRLAVFYAPLSFAASIFGMNTREINDSAPSLETFGIVAVAILAFSVIVVAGGHGIQKALRKRKEERGEAMLLQRRTETPAREACDVLPSGEKGYKMTAWKSSRAQLSFARRKRATNNWRSGDDAC